MLSKKWQFHQHSASNRSYPLRNIACFQLDADDACDVVVVVAGPYRAFGVLVRAGKLTAVHGNCLIGLDYD